MAQRSIQWKRGRGRLGVLLPLIGTWRATSDSPMGPVQCTRRFRPVLRGKYVELVARWEFADGFYEEIAIFGQRDGKPAFWSFTSDGKRSEGTMSLARDIHPEALCFEAKMPAGVARMIYWPDEGGGFHWAVESKSKRGWKRFTEHHYRTAQDNTDHP